MVFDYISASGDQTKHVTKKIVVRTSDALVLPVSFHMAIAAHSCSFGTGQDLHEQSICTT